MGLTGEMLLEQKILNKGGNGGTNSTSGPSITSREQGILLSRSVVSQRSPSVERSAHAITSTYLRPARKHTDRAQAFQNSTSVWPI